MAAIGVAVAIILAVVLTSQTFSPLTSVKDTDGDGTPDDRDPFPNNPSETKDSDGDGVGDNADEFPNDPNETKDTDGDGVGDKSDAFPTNPSETKDSDSDGVGDNADAFPFESTQWADRDHDGYGDNLGGINPDAFPDDVTEWRDADADQIGDNADFYDSGNGGVKITVTYFNGDCGNWLGDCDPSFRIYVDTNLDGTSDFSKRLDYYDDNTITSPISFIVDIADNKAQIKFWIQVYDLDGGDAVDYVPGTGTYYTHTVNKPYSDSWSYQGQGVPDCLLEYNISVVGV